MSHKTLHTHNQEGLTALMISSRSGRIELTKTLLSGQNISVDLQTVSKRCTASAVSECLHCTQITGWSALFFAAEVGEVETVDLLIKAGANLHLTDQVTQKDVNQLSCFSLISPTPLSHLPLQNGLSAEAVAATSDRRKVYQLLSGRGTREPSVPLATRITQVWRCGVAGLYVWSFLRHFLL